MTKAKIGILGSGQVARVLATGFLNNGHEVMIGTRDQGTLFEWHGANPSAKLGSFGEVASFGDMIVLAVKGNVAESLVNSVSGSLAGKTIIDTTNPIADSPPENGVLKFFSTLDESLMERLQRSVKNANFVKAFNSVGSALMVKPSFDDGKPTMFICGNSEPAKKEVTAALDDFGWEVADMGKVEAARAIEPLCMLWCIPGFLSNQWSHAFKLMKG
jgi:predicted dinucleotide-binding enzyme